MVWKLPTAKASELQASAKSAAAAVPSAARDAVQRVSQPQQPKPNSAGLLPPCYRCGKTGHSPDRCFFKTQKCRSCGKKGHIAKVCKSADKSGPQETQRPNATNSRSFPKRRQADHRAGYVELSDSCEVPDDADPRDLFAITGGEGTPEAAIMLEPEVDGVHDSTHGARHRCIMSLISEKVWRERLLKAELLKSDTLLKTYTGEKLRVLGHSQVLVRHIGQEQQLPLLVVAGKGLSLWGEIG